MLNRRAFVFDPKRRLAFVVLSNTAPDLRLSRRSGGGVGTANLARHVMRPRILQGGEGKRSC